MGDRMKKIIILVAILLITTGCTCEYNLKIENNKYSEEVVITANTTSERNNFNNTWTVPIDKDIYNIGLDTENDGTVEGHTYNSRISGNSLIFSYDFSRGEFANSTAASNCYKTFTISSSRGNTIISTSKEFTCFDDYPSLNSATINITVDGQVISNNADSKVGNKYTWNINKNNAKNKSIDLVIKGASNTQTEVATTSAPNGNGTNIETKKDYSMFIFVGIILLVILIGYAIFTKMKNKEEKI